MEKNVAYFENHLKIQESNNNNNENDGKGDFSPLKRQDLEKSKSSPIHQYLESQEEGLPMKPVELRKLPYRKEIIRNVWFKSEIRDY